MEVALLCILVGVFGFTVGIFAERLVRKNKSVGTLRIDQSDPTEAPYLFLELHTDVSNLEKKKLVTFEVNNTNYISQE